MLEQKYNSITKKYEWIDKGGANVKGVGDFRKNTLRDNNNIKRITEKLSKMSNWRSKQYIKGLKGLPTKVKRIYEQS